MRTQHLSLAVVLVAISLLSIPAPGAAFFTQRVAGTVLLVITLTNNRSYMLQDAVCRNRLWLPLLLSLLVLLLAPYLPPPRGGNLSLTSMGRAAWLFTSFLYFSCYELLMRGLVLNRFRALHPMPVAILLNILLYALMHLPKDRLETLACLPFGLLLCLLTLYCRSPVAAAILHTCLGLQMEGQLPFLHP